MLFNSPEFFLFLPLVWVLYWAASRGPLVLQNALIVVASYVFYGWWDWRFLALIALSTVTDFAVGLAMAAEDRERSRRRLLTLSLVVNLGILGFFKYYDFFAESLTQSLAALGLDAGFVTLRLVLPVGISFYTFQTLSYTIDVYRRRVEPVRDPVAFFAFVSFFPQLVAGPIERAGQLLPQFMTRRSFTEAEARDGLRLILWGMFKKVVVADTCGRFVDPVYANPALFSPSDIWLASFFFAIQIYGDFSGYSDIARGVAKLFGFQLMVNFDTPYFSRNVAEFWQRWHISLSTWFRDYVFIPLGGSRVGHGRWMRNILVTFVLSGLWHGANWTFVVWGALHGAYYLASRPRGGKPARRAESRHRSLPGWRDLPYIAVTFAAVLIAWVPFRAATLAHAGELFGAMASIQRWTLPHAEQYTPIILVIVFLGFEWLQRGRSHGLDMLNRPVYVRWCLYVILLIGILASTGESRSFIYFQF